MLSSTRAVLIALVCVAISTIKASLLEANPNYELRADQPVKKGGLVDIEEAQEDEYNDDYVGTDYSSYDDSDESDESSSSDIDWDEATKIRPVQTTAKLNTALSHTNSTKVSKQVLKLMKTYRTPITIALVTFAFRREIWMMMTYPTKDGRRRLRVPITTNPTSLLKIILFIDFVRKMQPGSMIDKRLDPTASSINQWLKPYFNAFIPPIEQHYTFEKLNNRYVKDRIAFNKALVDDPFKSQKTPSLPLPFGSRSHHGSSGFMSSVHSNTVGNMSTPESNGTVILLDMKGLDTTINKMDTIRDQIEFLLYTHRNMIDQTAHKNGSESNSVSTKELEIVILLESPGGSASDYGLAASQIGRLRNEPGITVTVCVDKVAASGGYMMAVMSSPGRLYAAPFSIVGSIGVIGQAVNIHNTLQKWGVKPLVFKGGKDKAPVGLVGEVTDEGIAKMQAFVDKTHSNFKRHVVTARPILEEDIDIIATGDIWLGYDAIEVGLIDRIITSDEYIGEKMRDHYTVLKLKKFEKPKIPLFGSPLSSGLIRLPSSQVVSNACNELHQVLSRFSKILDDVLEPKELSAQAYHDVNEA